MPEGWITTCVDFDSYDCGQAFGFLVKWPDGKRKLVRVSLAEILTLAGLEGEQ
jgi:hypothetical protein